MHVELSTDAAFSPEHIVHADSTAVEITSECSGRILLHELEPATVYYYRACLEKRSHGYYGPAGQCFRKGTFKTLPAASTNMAHRSFGLVTMTGRAVHNSNSLSDSGTITAASMSCEGLVSTLQQQQPDVCLLMGDMAVREGSSSSSSSRSSSNAATTAASAPTAAAAAMTREERVRR